MNVENRAARPGCDGLFLPKGGLLKQMGDRPAKEAFSDEAARKQRTGAWFVHLLTASGGVLGLFSLYAIHLGRFLTAFVLMGMTIVIDAIDGTLARKVRARDVVPEIDGSLLDNLVDYLNYVLVPAFFILVTDLLPPGGRALTAGLIMLSSAYQFSQSDAKTGDHFFKGFPSYWNIAVFYLFLWETSPFFNLFILLVLVPLVFIPIKYIHPFCLDHVTRDPLVRRIICAANGIFAASNVLLFVVYPETNRFLVALSVGYIILYALASLYRTFVPLKPLATALEHAGRDRGCGSGRN